MASGDECMWHADECVRFAGLTDDLTVRDSFLIWLKTGSSLRSARATAAMTRA